MLREIGYLKRIADNCRAGAPLDPELARWLATGLEDFLAHRVRHVDEALGIRSARGGVTWWKEAAIRERDAALRALAASHYPNGSPTAQARAIHTVARRYASGAWRHDREHSTPPNDDSRALLWRAFRSGAPMPIGERQLRDILRR